VNSPISSHSFQITLTDANLRQGHLYLGGCLAQFPADSVGPASSRDGLGKLLHLDVEGLSSPVLTDLPVDRRSGKPRGIFRKRAWLREFFSAHGLKAGDSVIIEQSERYRYSIKPNRPTNGRKAAEFFAGIGLVRIALERTGYDVVFANDLDPDKQELYAANFPADDFHLGDIHQLEASNVPDCDLHTASFPCNDLSIAGAMAGLNGEQSSAFWGLIRILEGKSRQQTLPFQILLENVPGFLMSHSGKDLEQALLALNGLGYSCDLVIVDALRFVPQSRARLFVIATLGREGRFVFGVEPCSARPKQVVEFMRRHPHINWDVTPLPHLPVAEHRLEGILEDLPHDHPAWWNEDRAAYFMAQLSDRHSAVAEQMMAQDKYTFGTAFRRVRNGRSMAELRTDGVAGCLRTPRGGSGRQILFKAGKGGRWVRLLTARECARLQGVPDSYQIDVPLNQALFGFGDAVCVPVVEWVLKHCVEPRSLGVK